MKTAPPILSLLSPLLLCAGCVVEVPAVTDAEAETEPDAGPEEPPDRRLEGATVTCARELNGCTVVEELPDGSEREFSSAQELEVVESPLVKDNLVDVAVPDRVGSFHVRLRSPESPEDDGWRLRAAVSGTEVLGFTEPNTVEIVDILGSFPPTLHGILGGVERDLSDQSSCPDPNVTWPPPEGCGYAWIEAETLSLKLHDQLVLDNPERLAHTVLNASAQLWFQNHMMLALSGFAGVPDAPFEDCHPCRTDESPERCSAQQAGKSIVEKYDATLMSYMTDFGQTVNAVLDEQAPEQNYFSGELTWVTSDGDACEPNARRAWVQKYILGGDPSPHTSHRIGFAPDCTSGTVGLENTSAAELPYVMVWHFSPGYEVRLVTGSMQQGGGTTQAYEAEAGSSLVQLEVAAPGSFELSKSEIFSCPGSD